MHHLKIVLAAALVALSGIAAKADDAAQIKAFYAFLSAPASAEAAAAAKAAMADDWVSIGDYSGYEKSREELLKQIAGLGGLIPDMTWKIEEMIVAGDRVIVRGRATGTPNGPFLGVDGKGKGFEIMTIDIHTMSGGKIVRTYHVEDWAGAMGQLAAE